MYQCVYATNTRQGTLILQRERVTYRQSPEKLVVTKSVLFSFHQRTFLSRYFRSLSVQEHFSSQCNSNRSLDAATTTTTTTTTTSTKRRARATKSDRINSNDDDDGDDNRWQVCVNGAGLSFQPNARRPAGPVLSARFHAVLRAHSSQVDT